MDWINEELAKGRSKQSIAKVFDSSN